MCRFSYQYQDGVRKFIENAKHYAKNPDMVICPCKVCKNLCSQTDNMLYMHMLKHGFDPLYKVWILHGEQASTSTHVEDLEMPTQTKECEMVEAYGMYNDAYLTCDGAGKSTHESVEDYYKKKLDEAQCPLYTGCTKYTKLSATTYLYKIKAINGLTDKGFNDFLEAIKDMLSNPNVLPDSLYTIKKFLKEFDLGYEKIDACVNDCCLFRKEQEHMEICPKCGESRWQVNPRTKKTKKGVPAKVLRYFPLIPRL